jgi:LmbE family N-acetylglucosaminyl deacetylase
MRFFLFALVLIPCQLFSQAPTQPDASRIKLRLKKLNFLGSVLYMAAHPDDENTRIITYMANERLATTGYLSLTRGDGGQNLIGPEIRDQLGVIRTQELLAARRIDGGQQFFTRAVDFGFSKSADETLRIWNKDEILSDVVKIFRQYQPDVIITRFPPDERAGHGHHTASAMLANEAFDVAPQADRYLETAKEFGVWQPRRLFTNTGRWWNKDINESTPGIITINIGGYNALLGKSYQEIAALSGSQHKSQGWGQQGSRGNFNEFLEPMKGDKAQQDIFEGVNTSWSRVKGGEAVQPLVDKAIKEFNPEEPSAIVPQLIAIKNAISKLETSVWKKRKLEETQQLILDCLGLYIQATAGYFQGSANENVKLNFEVINRSSRNVQLLKIKSAKIDFDTTMAQPLQNNIRLQLKSLHPIVPNARYSDPYWLADGHDIGLFNVSDKSNIGLPENNPAITFSFLISVDGENIEITKPLVYKWVDQVKGELSRPFEIVPPLFVNPSEKVLMFSDNTPKEIKYLLRSSVDHEQSGKLSLTLPAGWKSEPQSADFKFSTRDEEVNLVFKIFPSDNLSQSTITATAEVAGKSYDKAIQLIQYDHIPIQTLLPKAQTTVVRIDLKKEGKVVAYIKGAGDDIPAALKNMGYEVWEMKNEEVTRANLSRVDAVVLGVRALNTNTRIKYIMPELLSYVNEGGTLVVEYNTNFELQSEAYSPYSLKLSRDRVTEENSEVRILKPDHPAMTYPNKITSGDFEGWVQERGLYFPSEWDANFEALLSMNDLKEPPKDGSLLVAKYGKGYYVYTGLSFFRELPEGVGGAYRLFANLVSLGKAHKPEPAKVKSKAK